MNNKKTELLVAALENGTVIDHIPSELVFTIAQLLELEKLSSSVTIGYNLNSKKIGKKGVIKVADKFFSDEEISRLSVVAPNVVLNIIRVLMLAWVKITQSLLPAKVKSFSLKKPETKLLFQLLLTRLC